MITKFPHCSVVVSSLQDGHCPSCRGIISADAGGTLPDSDSPPDREIQLPDEEPLQTFSVTTFQTMGGYVELDGGSHRLWEHSDSSRPIAAKGFLRAIGFCFGLILVQAFAVGFARGFMREEGGLSAAGTFTITGIATFFFAYQTLKKRHDGDLSHVVAWRRPALFHLSAAALMAVPLLIGVAFLASGIWSERGLYAPTAIDWTTWQELYVELSLEPWWVVVLVGCVLPAVTEELFFRGLLGRGLIAAYGPVVGILLTSAIFGLFHVEPAHALTTFLLGTAFHLAYLATKSLIVPMLMHAANNLLAFSSLRLFETRQWLPVEGYAGEYLPGSLALASAGVVVMLFLFLWQTRVRWSQIDGKYWTPGFVSAETPPAALSVEAESRAAGNIVRVLLFCSFVGFSLVLGFTSRSWAGLTHANLAMIHSDAGNKKLANQHIRSALKWDRDQAWVQASAAWIDFKSGHRDRSMRHVREAMKLDPHLSLAYLVRAHIRLEEGDFLAAIADCSSAIHLDGSDPWPYRLRATIRLDLGEYSSAIDDATAALLRDPDDPVSFAVRGCCYGDQEKWDDSLKDLTEAVKRDPEYAFALTYRARAYYAQEQYSQAVDDATAAIAIDPENVDAFYYRALAHDALEHTKRARADYDECMRLDPSRVDLHRPRHGLSVRFW